MAVDMKHAGAYKATCDPDLSLKAKGLFFYLYMRHGEHVTVERIVEDCAEGVAAVRRAIKELEDAGYLRRERYYINRGAAYHWILL